MKRTWAALLALALCIGLSACGGEPAGEPSAPPEGDHVAGATWLAGDGSELVLEADGSFGWYQSEDVHDDNYYTGTYLTFRGDAAVDYVINELADYGITGEELDSFFERNREDAGYQRTNFVCLVLDNEKLIIGGENTMEETKRTPFYGFMLQEDTYLDLANMNTGNYEAFTKAGADGESPAGVY